MTKWRSLFYCQSWPLTAVMQTKHSREQRQNPVHIRGALLLRSDVLLFLSFWSGCSRCVLNVADTTTVDLEWRQSHITIRLINLRSAAALGFNTHTAFTQTNDGVMMYHCWALRWTTVTDREILFLPLSFAPAAMFPRQSGFRGRTPLLPLLIHSRLVKIRSVTYGKKLWKYKYKERNWG